MIAAPCPARNGLECLIGDFHAGLLGKRMELFRGVAGFRLFNKLGRKFIRVPELSFRLPIAQLVQSMTFARSTRLFWLLSEVAITR